jgi:hypothetical protein
MPPGHDVLFRKVALENFNICYGAWPGKVFGIDHLGDCKDPMMGALAATEMTPKLAGVPHWHAAMARR